MEGLFNIQAQSIGKQIHQLLNYNWEPSQSSLIFPLAFKYNQANDIRKFSQLVIQEMKRLTNQQMIKFQIKKSKMKKKLNFKQIESTQTRDIALQIYLTINLYPQNQITVFYVNNPTDLTVQNINYLQKNNIPTKFCLIIPTYAGFQLNNDVILVKQPQFQIFFFEACPNKKLFIQFVFECLLSQKLNPYLPKQVLTLITDLQYYPISYREACRRFIYVLQKFQKICSDQNIFKKKCVDIKLILLLINRSWQQVKRKITGISLHFEFESQVFKIITDEQIIKIIYDENYKYKVNKQNFIDWLNLFSLYQNPNELKNKIYNQFVEAIKQKIMNNSYYECLKKYSNLIESSSKQTIPQKNSRAKYPNLREIDKKKIKSNITAQQSLQNTINLLFKQCTKPIRQHGKKVMWSQICFQERIKPEFVRIVSQSAISDKDFKHIYGLISIYCCVPLKAAIKLCQNDEDYNIGKVIYMLRTLQIMGLIQITGRECRNNIFNNYYRKSFFNYQNQLKSQPLATNLIKKYQKVKNIDDFENSEQKNSGIIQDSFQKNLNNLKKIKQNPETIQNNSQMVKNKNKIIQDYNKIIQENNKYIKNYNQIHCNKKIQNSNQYFKNFNQGFKNQNKINQNSNQIIQNNQQMIQNNDQIKQNSNEIKLNNNQSIENNSQMKQQSNEINQQSNEIHQNQSQNRIQQQKDLIKKIL